MAPWSYTVVSELAVGLLVVTVVAWAAATSPCLAVAGSSSAVEASSAGFVVGPSGAFREAYSVSLAGLAGLAEGSCLVLLGMVAEPWASVVALLDPVQMAVGQLGPGVTGCIGPAVAETVAVVVASGAEPDLAESHLVA